MRLSRELIFTAILILVLLVSFPGFVPWNEDESLLVLRALHFNSLGRFPLDATPGVIGAAGVFYGPFPLWFYQILLAITHNLFLVSFIKIVLMSSLTFIPLYMFSMEKKLNPWAVIAVFTSPFIFRYFRMLWDNPLLIPLGAWMGLLVARQLIRPTLQRHFVMSLITAASLLTHLMSVFWVAASWSVLLVVQRKWWVRHWRVAVLVALPSIALCMPYFFAAYSARNDVVAKVTPALENIGVLVRGPLVMGGFSFFQYSLPELLNDAGTWGRIGIVGVTLAGALAWLIGFLRGVSRRREHVHLVVIAVLTLGLQTLAFIIKGIKPYPHYFNGSFFVIFFLFALGTSKWLTRVAIGSGFATILIFYWGFMTGGGGSSDCFGPSLNEQMRVAAEMFQSSREPKFHSQFHRTSQIIETLRNFVPQAPPGSPEQLSYEIRFRFPNTRRGFLEVVRSEGE